MIIALDLDSTLAEIMPIYCKIVKEQFGFSFTKEQIDRWSFWEDHIGLDNMWRIFREVWVRWYEIEPEDPNEGEVLYQAIDRGYEISIITATQKENLHYVYQWLEEWDIPYHSLIALFNGQSKFWYPFDAIIDDNPAMAEEARYYPDRKVFLYDQPWNRSAPETYVKRVISFSQMVRHLQE